jgi:hypothetical protein
MAERTILTFGEVRASARTCKSPFTVLAYGNMIDAVLGKGIMRLVS